MNTFDSTFEALALHYAGFGLFAVVNNVWTIVALVTAALSFWRLRGASLPLPLPLPSDRLSASIPIDSPPSSEETSAAIPPSHKVSAAPSACDGDVVTKGRFVTYYHCTGDDRCDATATATATDEEEEVERRGDRRCGGGAGEWWEGWEKALRLRSNGVGEGTGWYDYQDRAVLSGSVVRLWEEERRGVGLVIASPVTSSGRCCLGF